MTTTDQRKPGEKSGKRKQKKAKKAEQQQARAQLASAPVEPAIVTEAVVEHTAALEAAPAEPVQHEPVQRVASFSERMAAVAPPSAGAAAEKPAAPAEPVQAVPSPAAAAPVAGIQAIANAYRDYTRKSLEDAQSFADKLTAARSLDKAVEAQTEFAWQACETFAANSRRIRELHRELFWQAFRLPNWPIGRSSR
jgi:phasin family protein